MVKELAGLEELEREIPLVANLSFGKDSLAMTLALMYHGVKVTECVYADTGWEHESHYPYVEKITESLKRDFGLHVQTVRRHVQLSEEQETVAKEIEQIAGLHDSSFIRLMIQKAAFPSRIGKWCTPSLKQEPVLHYLKSNYAENTRASGVRREESKTRAHYPIFDEWIVNGTLEYVWNPIIEWSVSDVMDMFRVFNYPIHPLYTMGTNRVGCWPCIMCGNNDKYLLAQDTRRIKAIKKLEEYVSIQREDKRLFFFNPVAIRQFSSITEYLQWIRDRRGDLPPDMVIDSVCNRFGWCE